MVTRSRSRTRRKAGDSRRVARGPLPGRRERPWSIEELAAIVVRGGDELLTVDDPLEAEAWASAALGTFFKVDAPLAARDELEQALWPLVLSIAERQSDRAGLAVLEALAAVADDLKIALGARQAAARLRGRGVEPPAWAQELGSAVFDSAWVMTDIYGDHEAYYATFRYPGRQPHVVNALYDRMMGEIIKDAFVGYLKADPRLEMPLEEGVSVADADPKLMARRVIDAIASGDLYIDNDWTPEFKRFRALLLARMTRLPAVRSIKRPIAPGVVARRRLVRDFLITAFAPDDEVAETIAHHCLDYSCDYLGDDGLRWSPIVAEMFLTDYLPRKVSLGLDEVRRLPEVLREWVRFALARRGLEGRWITETQEAVDRWAKDFRAAMTDSRTFGPAKSIYNAMLADSVDVANEAAVQRWIDDFNRRPIAERDALLGTLDN